MNGCRAGRPKFIVIRMSEWFLLKHPADPKCCFCTVDLTGSRIASPSAPLLAFLHWLSGKSRKGLKLILLSYKVLRGQTPSYLEEPIAPDHPGRPLHSRSAAVLVAARILKSERVEGFTYLAPPLWNQLAVQVRRLTSSPLLRLSQKPSSLRKL